jgi:hypothetical protein
MGVVLLELTAPPIADDGIELVDDVEELGSMNRCSCSASDDAPYQ